MPALITSYSTPKCINCSSLASIHDNSYTSFPCSLKGYTDEAWKLHVSIKSYLIINCESRLFQCARFTKISLDLLTIYILIVIN